ncbi:hypothetical protein OQZ33_06965 [Pedobacter sp. MC2016-05]|uniref:hypothetical protein n=1 Tax=Pedobacter sp. MC2016-05 TaxID=2994474 RepID=UPI00224726E7|nr:hypothetical protein [Pedobacter sp. MC2016-05]MCX2474065.1 hypothetical protein [Pedobacter sp. MC2016-05]
MKTLQEQGVSVITQTRTILSAKYGYIINAPYTDEFTELTSKDNATSILLYEADGAISYNVGLQKPNEKKQAEVMQLVNDVLDIVHILN